jgi:PBP1b-binding outer membrane lipoprotein LpoB
MKYFLIVMLLVIVSACSSESVETNTESVTVDIDTTAVNTVEVDSVSIEVVETVVE